jgi:hypothetical protein
VCKPIVAMSYRKLARSRKILGIIWILSILLMMPVIILSGVEKFPFISNSESFENDDKSACEEKIKAEGTFQRPTCTLKLPQNKIIPTEIVFVIYSILVSFVIPIIIIIIFYICVLRRLNKRIYQLQSKSNIKYLARRKVTILVMTVIGIYMITNTPLWINQVVLIIYYSISKSQSDSFYSITTRLSTIFQIILGFNSALNPYLYAFLSEAFRETFKTVFKCFFCKWLFSDKKSERFLSCLRKKYSDNQQIEVNKLFVRRLTRFEFIYNQSSIHSKHSQSKNNFKTCKSRDEMNQSNENLPLSNMEDSIKN